MKRYEFSVDYVQFLNEDSQLVQVLPECVQDLDEAVTAYKMMVLGRIFDSKAISLQRTGQLGTYPSILGQEAIGAGIGLAMHQDDIFIPYYRDLITQYIRGVALSESLLYWGGDERGSAYKNCKQDFPNCVPIATQYGHAAGAAISLKSQGIKRAALVTCGEGATSKGDFLESLNLAGAWQLPLVMVVNNNQWAISTPRHHQTAAVTIAQKAVSAGIPGVQVDGNDYFSVAYAVKTALKKAYQGKGPTLIEAVTYRLSDHTTADDASRYRSDKELELAWKHEPVARLKKFLLQSGCWNEEQQDQYESEVKRIVDVAVQEYQSIPDEPAEAMFDYLYESLPEPLMEQYAQIKYCNLMMKEGSL